jgi:tetratricopeptide (TPR) repeat protein
MKTTISNRLVFLVIIVIGILYYGNTIQYGFSLDDNYIFQQIPKEGSDFLSCFNVFKQSFDKVDYRPIAMFTFAVEQWLFGSLRPDIAHGFNLFYYIILCISIFLVVRKFPYKHAHYLGLFTAIIFLIHPVHSNVVSNIKSRDTILSLLASIWSIYFFIAPVKKKYLSYIIGLCLFALSSIIKLDSVGLIFILPLSLFFFTEIKIKKVLTWVVFILIFSMMFRIIFVSKVVDFDTSSNAGTLFMENPIVSDWTINNRLGQSVLTLLYYVKFMFIPEGYYFYFGFDMLPLKGILHWTSILILLFHLAIIYAAYILFKKEEKIPAYSILFFYFALAYCSNIAVPVAGIIADRYAFIASLGFCIFLAWLIIFLMEKQQQKASMSLEKTDKNKVSDKHSTIKNRFILLIPLVVLVLLYFPFSRSRSVAWKNIITLMDKDIPHLKKSYEANRIAVTHYLKAAQKQTSKDSAQYLYAKALTCATDADELYPNEIFILESKGISYYGLGNQKAALAAFKKVIQLTDSSIVSMDILGDMLYRDKQLNLASVFYYKTLKLDSLTDIGYYKYLNALVNQDKYEAALRFSDSLIALKPDFEVAYECKGFTLLNKKDTVQSSIYYLKAFEKGMTSINYANLFRDYYLMKNDKINASKFEKYRFGQQILANP